MRKNNLSIIDTKKFIPLGDDSYLSKNKNSIGKEAKAKATAFVIAKRKSSAQSTTKLSAKMSPAGKASQALDELANYIMGKGRRIEGWGLKQNTLLHPALIREYAQMLCEHVAKLNSLIDDETFLKALLPFSQSCFAWPVRVGKRKPFGEDQDKLIKKIQVGKLTIAADPNARFNPSKRFGKVAFDLLQRIEWERINTRFFIFEKSSPPMWSYDAKALPSFNTKASSEDKKQWLAVVKQILDEDLSDPEVVKSYRHLITASSHEKRWRAVFFDKIRGEFDSLWGLHRQGKK